MKYGKTDNNYVLDVVPFLSRYHGNRKQQRVWGHYEAIADSAFPDPVPLGTGSGNAESAIAP